MASDIQFQTQVNVIVSMKNQGTEKISLIAAGILLALGAITNIGCGSGIATKDTSVLVPVADTAKAAQMDLKNDSAIKVFVNASGKITANGNPTNLIMLDSAFSRLKNTGGAVYYSRDNIQADPSEESMKVIELIVKYQLSVRFYTDKTFTKVAEVQ